MAIIHKKEIQKFTENSPQDKNCGEFLGYPH